jgi:hypothetical protein
VNEILCVLLPRRDATPEQLKALGEALCTWSEMEQESGLHAGFRTRGVDDLLEGEMPQPLAIRKAKDLPPEPEGRDMKKVLEEAKRMADLPPEERDRLEAERQAIVPGAVQRAKQELGELASSRLILLSVTPHWVHPDRKRVIQGLKKYIPKELVEDIDVEGRSWTTRPRR